MHLRPDGRGTVRLKSPDPLAPPAIQFNFLRQRLRLPGADRRHAAGAQDRRRSRRLQALCRRGDDARPGLSRPTTQFDAEIRVRGVSNLHPVGTCRMGREVDAVVDPRLRVHGIAGPARRRRLDHAAGAGRQHQRAVDHDRREVRRDDPEDARAA